MDIQLNDVLIMKKVDIRCAMVLLLLMMVDYLD